MSHIWMRYWSMTHHTDTTPVVRLTVWGSTILIGLFCKRALSNRRYSAKETCNFIATPYRQ